ncbi:MAG TPA: dTMP kinase [archaeon]|nr:dTMP kinase [archaeon]
MPGGKFIVIEGLDGSGCGTQAEILREKLMANEHVIFLRYPEYTHPIGELIYKYLKQKFLVTQETLFMLFVLDQAKDKERIADALESNKIILADRYFTSNLAFQCSRGFDLKKALTIAETLELPKPDIVIFLKVSPEISLKRKQKEKQSLDIYEKDLELQKKVAAMYEKLTAEKVFAKEWVVVDGEKDIGEVASEVEKVVREKFGDFESSN